jgi:y4mF family transcriptional regulator
MNKIAEFVKTRRKQLRLTQEEFADKAGVALTVIRKIEQGKENLNLAKVNHVLNMFGHVLAPTNSKDPNRFSQIGLNSESSET